MYLLVDRNERIPHHRNPRFVDGTAGVEGGDNDLARDVVVQDVEAQRHVLCLLEHAKRCLLRRFGRGDERELVLVARLLPNGSRELELPVIHNLRARAGRIDIRASPPSMRSRAHWRWRKPTIRF